MDLWPSYATHSVCLCVFTRTVRLLAESHYILLLKKNQTFVRVKCECASKYRSVRNGFMDSLRSAFCKPFVSSVGRAQCAFFSSSQLFVLNNGLNDFNLWPNGRNAMH